MRVMRCYVLVVDRFNRSLGKVMMYGVFVIMAVLMWSTISKIGWDPSLWTLEAAQFSMVVYFFLGGPYAIQTGSHVRMDLFYDKWSPKRKALVDAISVLCLLIYLIALLLGAIGSTAYSLGYFGSDALSFFVGLITGEQSLGFLERSRTIWQPYLWPIKLVMCVGIILMLAQSISELFKDILLLRQEEV